MRRPVRRPAAGRRVAGARCERGGGWGHQGWGGGGRGSGPELQPVAGLAAAPAHVVPLGA